MLREVEPTVNNKCSSAVVIYMSRLALLNNLVRDFSFSALFLEPPSLAIPATSFFHTSFPSTFSIAFSHSHGRTSLAVQASLNWSCHLRIATKCRLLHKITKLLRNQEDQREGGGQMWPKRSEHQVLFHRMLQA